MGPKITGKTTAPRGFIEPQERVSICKGKWKYDATVKTIVLNVDDGHLLSLNWDFLLQ
jgi:hypothetical protein